MTKYRAKPQIIDGVRFASKREADVYLSLKALNRSGEIRDLHLQPKFKFPMGFSYVADFDITYKNGKRVVVDVKGVETPVFKLKKKCMAHFYPLVDLEIWK